MIRIQNLSVSIDDKKIINNLNLDISSGTIHALMGPNGSGKSTLAYTMLGHPSCRVIEGSIVIDGRDITDLSVEKRAKLGIFLAFQYPQEIPGLKIFTYLKEIYTAFTGKSIPVAEFYELVKNCLNRLNLPESFLERGLNEGFSGGEKKRLEMLQLILLNPKIAIIDEIDSGLDIDALKAVADALKECKKENPDLTIILVTHYQRILDYIKPDFVHIFYNGSIIKSGDANLPKEIELRGYNEFSGGRSC